jgi:hypothetical protein
VPTGPLKWCCLRLTIRAEAGQAADFSGVIRAEVG